MQCDGCRAKDCGNCINCKDMKRYGGSGKKKKACVMRNCLAKSVKLVSLNTVIQ